MKSSVQRSGHPHSQTKHMTSHIRYEGRVDTPIPIVNADVSPALPRNVMIPENWQVQNVPFYHGDVDILGMSVPASAHPFNMRYYCDPLIICQTCF